MKLKYSVENLVAYDLEVYPNYFLAGFLFPNGLFYQYQFTDQDVSELKALRDFINYLEKSEYTLVGYNSNSYDDIVLSEFLASPGVQTAYRTSVQIIEENRPAWDFIQDIRSVDLIRILPNSMSLKKIGVCLGHPKLQELPIHPHQALKPEEMQIIRAYNRNDIDITRKLAEQIKSELVLRQDLSREYDIDLRSKGEATIAELILTDHINRATGLTKKELNGIARDAILRNPTFQIPAPSWWKDLPLDNYPSLQIVIEKGNDIFQRRIHVVDYKLESGVFSDTLFIGDRWYQMGIGGLHSVDGAGAWIPLDDEICLDADVTSYYPALMLTQKLSPRHWIVDGTDHFRLVFSNIVKKRLSAKDRGDKSVADRLKIVINGTFGKTNEQYSPMYDPSVLASVTVIGQLALLVLVAMVNDRGSNVVSANTDGVTLLHKKNNDSLIRTVIQEWETLTKLSMEFTEYKALFQKDVNNYIAVPTKGSPKAKGIFNIPKMGGVDLRHTPNAQIIARAVIENLVNDKDITLTITQCKDIQEFILTQQVKGDWAVTWRDAPLGKMVRFYKSVDGSPILRTPMHEGVKGNAGIVANSESSRPLADLPASFESISDLDYSWYIRQANELLDLISVEKQPYMNAIAWMLHREGMTPCLIKRGVNDRKSPTIGDTDFTSMRDDECMAVCTGRNYGVIAQRFLSGRTRFYKVDRKYPSRTRSSVSEELDGELLFGSNVEVSPYDMLYQVDEDKLESFYTPTELRNAR